MKKLIIILLLPLYVYSQDYTSFLPEVAWRTIVDSVVYQSDNTYTVKVSPIDINDPGAFNKVIGTFLTDNKGRAYEITDSLTLSTGSRVITVVDVYRSGAAPFSGAIGYITKAPGNGNSHGLSVNYFEELDNKAIDYKRRIDNRILWEHGQTIPFDSMRLDINYVSSGTEPTATVYWDNDNKTISFPVPDGGVIQIGQEPHDYYHNLEGAAIVNGDIVSTCGASGNRTAVCLTDATDDVKSLAAFGMVTVPTIGNNNVGRITKSGGKVRGLNTIAYVEGTELYVDPLNKGKWTATMPAAPNRAIKIGTVAVSHAVNGVVELQIQVLPKLSELADVNGTPLAESGQIPVWDDDSGYFDFDHKLWGVDTGLIQSKAYDSTWNGLDSVAPSKNAVYDKINSMEPIDYCPDTTIVNKGTISGGSINNLCAKDGNVLTVTELAGADPLRITFTFTNVVRMNFFIFYGAYIGGANHVLFAEIYNPSTLAWDYLGVFGLDATAKWHSFPIYLPNTYISGGNVQIRIAHQDSGNPAHYITLDYVDVNFGGGGGGISETASEIAFVPTGSVASTNVQTAIAEVDSEKAAGAASSTDNAIARFDGTTGKLIQNSGVTIDDNSRIYSKEILINKSNFPSNEVDGIYVSATYSGSESVIRGIKTESHYSGTYAQTGIESSSYIEGSNNQNHANAIQSWLYNTSSGTTTYTSNYYASKTLTSGTITDHYGYLYNAGTLGGATIGNDYAFYSQGTNVSLFEGGLIISPTKLSTTNRRQRLSSYDDTNKTAVGIFTAGIGVYSTRAAAANNIGAIAFGSARTGLASSYYENAFIAGGNDAANQYGGYLQFNTTSSGGGGEIASGNYERMRIASTGNILIGTTIDNATDKLQINGSGLATTMKLTNGTDNFILYHVSDAAGLANSNVYQSSNILLYNTANTFSTDREIPDVGWVKSGVMAGKTSTTASTALTNTDYTVICQTGVTKLLFPSSPATGKVFVLVNHTGSAISLRNSGDTGDVSYTNYSAATVTTLAANSAIRIQYIGTTWYLIE